ncbi:hypothetical protein VOLCADRAFT_119370 [Volvox carteri f. nagariensis]|uniref:PH domain-containing protein n=1 Tax=Volvox carteri f. nagariensis TaxID=3068 RepID=D8UCH9_VOLCA|nr:uncharacterized protein VOLCADRAFT_119370 [Volvox carteri f. nagariensis]EFJ42554.1 hypothetical protein VOLCADRAFT_119370 [Volvox carteri f. nagariensis]|eukprot:XP_002956410.1 hypothetical protein VOLCADRAFT_119370 [Volvox carteri f. nagariensis]
MASDFKGTSEKFRMNLVSHEGQNERVVVQIGLDGLKLLNASDNRTMRAYDLSHISRWQSRGGSLIIYTRTPVDVEERQTTLSADDNTVRSALDTLTCCCMQLAELLQSRQTETAQETANNLHALVVGGGKKKTQLPSADEVEYWRSPDKAGWLQSQGDHLKNWRNRWFVLKQGYLFRFYNDKVTEATKPRGVVDLSKVQDVKVLPGRANTIQLKTTSGGTVCYIAGSETEVVEWVSAMEGAMQKICKHIAGVEDEPPAPQAKAQQPKNPSEWLRQLEKNFESSGGTGGVGGSGGAGYNRNLGNTLVNVVGYDDVPSSSGGGGGGGGGGSGGYRDTYRDTSPYAVLNRQYSSGYTPIQGIVTALPRKPRTEEGRRGEYGVLDVCAGRCREMGTVNGGRKVEIWEGLGVLGTQEGRKHSCAAESPVSFSFTVVIWATVSASSLLARCSTCAAACLLQFSGHNIGSLGRSGLLRTFRGGPGSALLMSWVPTLPHAGMAGIAGAQALTSDLDLNYGGGGGGVSSQSSYGQQQQRHSYAPVSMPVQQQAPPNGASAYGAQQYGYSQQQQAAVSLIDQVPPQQPAYPTYFQQPAMPAQQQQPQQVHYTAEGRPYYYNGATGVTQWEPPAGYA